jgi:hypothetical protein
MNRLAAIAAALGFSLGLGGARAQLALPGAELSTPAPAEGTAKPAAKRRRRPAAAERLVADPGAIVGKTLRLNGRDGALTLARGEDKSLKIVKFVLPGEVVSHPAQKCEINFVSEAPIEAVSKGEPDGLPRYGADIPACPLTFDVVDGAVIVPAQSNACVFSAADCQASPSGLWGPPASEIDLKGVLKARAAADRSIQESQRELVRRDADAAASLAREQSDFASLRDDVCQGYDGERRLGFCASRLAQTRAALLAKRAAAAGPPPEPKRKRRQKKAP